MQQEPCAAPDMGDNERRFGGVTRLLGEPAHARLRAARVAVVGVGGVGSWAAEALARATGLRGVPCGAAGGRTDPTRIRCADLARALGDPLLAKVRYRLRRRHGFAREAANRRPLFGVDAIYSDEPVRRPEEVPGVRVSGLACAGYGSSVAVT